MLNLGFFLTDFFCKSGPRPLVKVCASCSVQCFDTVGLGGRKDI